MVIHDYVNVEFLLERVSRFPIKGQDDLNPESIIEWVSEAIYEIGAPIQFVELEATLVVRDGKVALPRSLHAIHEVIEIHHNKNLEDVGTGIFQPWSYKLHNGMMYTDFREGDLYIRYRSYPTDERGYPLILNNEDFIKGVELYVLERIGFQALLKGEIQGNVYQLLRSDKNLAINRARNAANYLDENRMANLQRILLNPYVDARRKTNRKWRFQ